MKTLSRTARAAVAGAVVIGLAACGGGASPSPTEMAEGSTVAVTLQEWAVVPDVESAPAGSVTFNVTNEGPDDVHEFVILGTDLAPDALPTDETGTVDEAGEGIEVIDEIEDIAVGDSGSVTVDLEAGSYVLLCNIYTEEEAEAHYTMGMRTAFTVEG
jgi:uncharacterized cupredoxin-like copper-binding protein